MSTTGLFALMLSMLLLINLAVWSNKIVFSPSYVTVGAISFETKEIPE